MNKKELKLLRQINAEAIGKYGDKLFVEREKAGTMNKVIDLALKEEKYKLTPAQKDKLINIRDSGMLDGTVREEDPKVAKKIESYVAKRIKEEIEKGNLREPSEKKKKQYINRAKKNNNGRSN